MWRIIFIAALPYIVGAAAKPLVPPEGPLWREKLAEAFLQDANNYNFDSDNDENFRNYFLRDRLDDGDSDYVDPRPVSGKRALAIFNRWGSITGIGKNRTPIRSNVYDPEYPINTQTRGRVLGQPLRWG